MTNFKYRSKELIKLTIAIICYYFGIFRIMVFFKKHKPLTYHNVIKDEYFDNTIHLGVSHSESVFRSHVSVLSNFFKDENLSFTFDDGYLNNLTTVVPILNEFNLKGLFFVPLEKNEKSIPFWVDRIMFLFSYCEPGSYSFSKSIIFINDNNRLNAFGELFQYVNLNYSEMDDIMENVDGYLLELESKISEDYFNLRFTFINDEGIKTMIDEGHKIGFHTLNHDILSKCSVIEIEKELQIVKNKLNLYQIDNFSFPFGGSKDINFQAIPLLQSYGLKNLYSNVDKKMDTKIISRRGIGNTKNKYMILAYYLNIFK
jgi:peptidoglycan/xylan/chitin deacetylase (PgdA/CDA1 family)